MKKILVIFAFSSFLFPISASSQGAWDIHHFNIGIDYAYRPSQLELGTGLFAAHPERAMHLGLNYRLLRHWELGFYLGFQGCNFYGYSHHTLGGTTVGSLFYENGLFVNYGFLVQLHLMPFDKRNDSWADLLLRIGIGQGYEEDGAWAGFGVVWNATNHLSVQLCTDFGGWFGHEAIYDANFTEYGAATSHFRTVIGLKIEL
jgi:hypothetical protein